MTRFVILGLVIISAYLSAFAQQAANATLAGNIVDQMGAVIANTKITATQTATGVIRETISNEVGFYVFSNITPGEYELKFDAVGFATKAIKAVSLNVGQTVTLNVQLEVSMKDALNVDYFTYT